MSKVMVTGAAGFIGSHLVQRLVDDGDSVVAVVRRKSQADALAGERIEPRLADVRDAAAIRAAVRDVQVVYHLAGRIFAKSLEDFRAVNVAGVRNVAAACAACSSPPTLVVVSSLAAAGPSRAGQPRTESDPPAPISNYGRSKLEGEQAAAEWADKVPISIVRPPFVFGGGDRASIMLFRYIHRWGMHFLPCGHDLELSLVHVDDIVRALIAIAERGRRKLQQFYAGLDLFLPAARRVYCTLQRAYWLFAEDTSLTPPANYRLATLCEYFGVKLPDDAAHDALHDVRATLNLYHAMKGHASVLHVEAA